MQGHPQLKLEGDLLIRPLHVPDGLHLPIETYIPPGARFPEQIGSSGSKNEAQTEDHTPSSSRPQSDSNRKAVAKYRQKVKERYNHLEQQRDMDLKRLSSAEAELKRLQVQTRALQVMMEQSKAGKGLATAGMLIEDPRKTGVTLQVFRPPVRLTHDQVLRLSLQDHFTIARECACRIAEIFAEDEAFSTSTSIEKRLVEILEDRHQLTRYICRFNPHIAYKLAVLGLMDQEFGPQDWKALQEELGFSAEQKEHLLGAYNTHLQKVSLIWDKRRLLHEQLEASQIDDDCITAITKELTDSLTEEHICNGKLYFALYRDPRGFTPIQEAQVVLSSYPHMPQYAAVIRSMQP